MAAKPKNRFDEAGSKLDKPRGLPTNDQLEAIKFARNQERDIGKLARDAKRNGDTKAYLLAVGAGYTNRGIENVDDKTDRYIEKANQKRFQGDTVVGPGQQPAGNAQQPAGGEALGNGRGDKPWNARSAAQGSSGKQWVNVGEVPLEGAQQPAGEQQQVPSARTGGITPVMINGKEALFAGNDDSVWRAAIADRDNRYGDNASPTGAQPSIPAKPKSFFEERTSGRQAFVDTVRNQRSGEEGVTDKFSEQARKQGAALGLTPQQIQDTLDGQTELSPEAIAGRAKGRKDEAYQKEFGDSDKEWAESIKDLPASMKTTLEALSPQEKKDALAKTKEKVAASRAEIDQKRSERETIAKQELDTYDPLGDALDRAKKLADESIESAASRSEKFKTLQESNEKARLEDQNNLSYMRLEADYYDRKNDIDQILSGERSKYIDSTASLNLGEYDSSPFKNDDRKDLLPPDDKIGKMTEQEIGDYVSKKTKIEEEKSKLFNEALGGETRESKTNLIPLEGKELSDELYRAERGKLRPKTNKGKEYTSDAVSAIKKVALGGYTGPQLAGEMGRARDIKRAQAKILDAAAKTGYAIWNDKELMGDASFSKMIGEDPRFKGKVPSGNGAPQAFIQPVKVDDLFNSLDKSQSRANLMTRPLMS